VGKERHLRKKQGRGTRAPKISPIKPVRQHPSIEEDRKVNGTRKKRNSLSKKKRKGKPEGGKRALQRGLKEKAGPNHTLKDGMGIEGEGRGEKAES